jgi:8-oxo-dGTP pyrophosphatase MutT (NUDIX family)
MDELNQPSRPDVLDVTARTTDAPFCAGVIVSRGDSLLVTLNSDGLPPELENNTWRVGGVGGGQELGETIIECAVREAQEELSTPVTVRSVAGDLLSGFGHWRVPQNPMYRYVRPITATEETQSYPERPFRPGLPTGLHIYFGLYLAAEVPTNMLPGDDVIALLFLPFEYWSMLDDMPTLEFVMRHGAQLVGSHPNVQPTQRLWSPTDESFRTVATLLLRHPDLRLNSAGATG